jgi:hypothetical protein
MTDIVDNTDSVTLEEPIRQEPIIEESKLNFEVTQEYSSNKPEPIKGESEVERTSMPSSTIEDVRLMLAKHKESKIAEGEGGEKWFNTLQAGSENTPLADMLSKTTSRIPAKFKQKISINGKDLNGGTPKLGSKEGVKYTGEAARLRIRQALGMGTAMTAPLWHSGFWVTLKTPSEASLLELYRQINNYKISLGRSTYGLQFSNSTTYTSKALMEFIVDHIYNTTLKLDDNNDLAKHVDVRDLPILIWAIACATWPRGFNYDRACATDPTICRHVTEEKLDLRKLQWTDSLSLTDRQVTHMLNRTLNSVTVEQLDIYKSDFIRGKDTRVKISENGYVTLKTPTIQEHLDAGVKWVDGIENRYAKIMTESEGDREKGLFNQAKATLMRQYSHFVKSIEVNEEEYKDRELIDEVLDDLSSEDGFRDKFIESCGKFIDESVISLIAIPTYKCASCGEEQSPNKSKGLFSSLIAIDVANTFFTLLVQRLMKIQNR